MFKLSGHSYKNVTVPPENIRTFAEVKSLDVFCLVQKEFRWDKENQELLF